MRAILAALAIISIATPATAETDPLLEPPAELAWPPDLPRQHFVPRGKLTPTDTELTPRWVPGGWLLPHDLADHVEDRLEYLDAQPKLCGKKLRGLDKVRAADLKAAVDNCKARCRERLTEASVEETSGFSLLEVVGVAASAVAAGAIIGIVIGLAVDD